VALRLPHGVYGLDVDDYSGKSGGAALGRLVEALGALPATWVISSRDDSVSGIRLFAAPLPAGRRWRDEPAGHGAGIEAIHFGHRYAVTWPSTHPDTGRKYLLRRPDGALADDGELPRPDELPALPPEWVHALSEAGEPRLGEVAGHEETVEAVAGWPVGEACSRVRGARARGLARLRDAVDGAALHPAGRDATQELVNLGHEGHVGARAALAEHYSAFVEVRAGRKGTQGARGKAEAEWWRLVRGAVGKLAGAAREHCDCELRSGEGVTFERSDFSMPPVEPQPGAEQEQALALFEDLYREEILEEGKRLRIRDVASQRYAAFRHARDWTEPVFHGSLDRELLIQDTDPQWRVQGMLGNGHNAILVAGRKTGKTTLINDLVRAYVDGERFLGTQDVTPTGRGVAVFNYEVDERQYRQWLRDVGIINTHHVHAMHLRGRTLPLINPQVRKWTTAWLAERDIGLWVLDPYSRAYLGSVLNGNDEAQVSAFLDTLDVIKAEASVSELVMPVHTPKARVEIGEETAIGSQRLEGWPDAMWFLTRDGRQRYLRAEGRDIEVRETQLNYDSNSRRLTLDQFGTDRRVAREQAKATKHAAEQAAELNRLIEFVHSEPGCTSNAISGALGFNRAKIGALVAGSDGRIVIKPGPSRAQEHYLKEDLDEPS
jgi:hypothetical protein